MAYFKEYPFIMENLDQSYDPFVNKLKKVILLTDQLFGTQIHPVYGVYPKDFSEWLKKNPKYKPKPYTVARFQGINVEEIPYHVFYKQAVYKLAKHLDEASKTLDAIQDKSFDKEWWKKYLAMLQDGFTKDRWDAVQKMYLETPQASPLLLSIGPIDAYHDKYFSTKRFFSAWLLVKNKKFENQTLPLWQMVKDLVDNKSQHPSQMTLYLGDLLFSGGEVAKYNSMGWSRPEDAQVAQSIGSVKAIAVNRLPAHTKKMGEAMTGLIAKSNLSNTLQADLMAFHTDHSLIPLLLHELGHTYDKLDKANALLGEFYPLIEETRANTNMAYLALLLEKENQVPAHTARNIVLRVLFYFNYLYEEFNVRKQREAYLFACLVWMKRAEDAGLIRITDKLFVDETKLDEIIKSFIEDTRLYLNKVIVKGDKKEIEKLITNLFAFGETVNKKLL